MYAALVAEGPTWRRSAIGLPLVGWPMDGWWFAQAPMANVGFVPLRFADSVMKSSWSLNRFC